MARVFLSYRRDDSSGYTGRIFDHLADRLGDNSVFMDVQGIEPGENFARIIESRVGDCDAMVVVIGRQWLCVTDAAGRRRIDAPADYVRLEIEFALKMGVEIIPVLVAGAAMPREEELPDTVRQLAVLQALEIDDKAFRTGSERLIATLERAIARSRERRRLARPGIKERRRIQIAPPPVLRIPGSFAAETPRPGSDTHSRDRVVRENTIRRFLLLYRPAHKLTWVLHGLFYLSLAVFLIGATAIWVDMRDVRIIMAVFAAYLSILLVLRAIALVVEPDPTASRVRRWFLLFKPPRAGMTLVHLVFVLMLVVLGLMMAGLPDELAGHNDVAKFMFLLVPVLWAIAAFVIRELGAARDPLRPIGTPPNWFAKLMYLRRARRAWGWLPRVIFYSSSLIVLLLAPNMFADENGQFAIKSLATNWGDIVVEAAYVTIAICSRGWAASVERGVRVTTGDGTDRLRRQLLVFTPQRAAGFAPLLLFWAAILVGIGLLANGAATLSFLQQPPEASRVYLGLLAAVIAVCSHEWAKMYHATPAGLAQAAGA